MATASPFNAALRDVVYRLRSATTELERHDDRDTLAEKAAELAMGLTRSAEAALCLGPSGDYDRSFSVRADGAGPLAPDEVGNLLRSARLAGVHVEDGHRVPLSRAGRMVALGEELRFLGDHIGVLAVGRQSEYDDTERQVFAIFAAHVASALQSRAVGSKSAPLQVDEGALAEKLRTAERVERAHELAVQVLLAVSSHAVAGQGLPDFYRRLATTVGELVEAKRVMFWRLGDGSTLNPIAGGYGFDEKFRSRLTPTRCDPGSDDLASRVVFKDFMFRANRSAEGAEFDYVLDRLGVESAISVPWRAGQERLGLLAAYDSTRTGGFSREDTWVLQKAGIAAALVTQLWHTQEDLRKSVERLSKVDAARQLLLRNMTTVVDKERKRFVHELHDDALQKLTAVEMHVARLAPEGKVDAAALETITELLNQTDNALRRLVFEVHPPSIEAPDGLVRSITDRIAMLSGTGIEREVTIDLPEDIDLDMKSLIFRQVAEAVGNVERHSKATLVKVVLKQSDGGILGVVEDNGKGFVVSERSNIPGHLGLLALKERTLMAGGRYKIESHPGAGTRVEFWIPVERK